MQQLWRGEIEKNEIKKKLPVDLFSVEENVNVEVIKIQI